MISLGGPSQAEENLTSAGTSLSNELSGYMQQEYGQQQGIYNDLTSILSPMAAAGPNQAGYNAAESNALNTGAIDTAAGNYGAAARKVGSQLAGSGTNAGPSGVQEQLEAGVAAQGAGEAAQAENQIQQQNYAVGRQNWQQEMAGLNQVGSELNPLGFGGEALSANQNAFKEADTTNQESQQEIGDLVSGITDVASTIGGNLQSGGNPLLNIMAGL